MICIAQQIRKDYLFIIISFILILFFSHFSCPPVEKDNPGAMCDPCGGSAGRCALRLLFVSCNQVFLMWGMMQLRFGPIQESIPLVLVLL